ncbi:MAG: hypothetical protein AAGG02_11525 [Cyanobacteria bacterium P01_H01_bin.15]
MTKLSANTQVPCWYQVPPGIQHLLLAAVASWEDTYRSETFILQAINHPEATLDVLVSAYRYFFYKSNNAMARRLAMQVMEQIKFQKSLPDDWESLQVILRDQLSEPMIRLYLSAYTALGMMLARWGAFQAALEISTRIQSIDSNDEFGAELIQKILTSDADETET